MGFLKKVGGGLKKFVKQNVNFKSLVSLAGSIPIAGGVIDKVAQTVQANKDAKSQALAQKDAQTQFIQVQQENATVQALKDAGTQMANNLAKNGTEKLTESLLDSVYAGTSNGAKSSVAKMGADLTDLTITEWVKKHLKHIAMVGGAIGLYFIIRKNGGKKQRF